MQTWPVTSDSVPGKMPVTAGHGLRSAHGRRMMTHPHFSKGTATLLVLVGLRTELELPGAPPVMHASAQEGCACAWELCSPGTPTEKQALMAVSARLSPICQLLFLPYLIARIDEDPLKVIHSAPWRCFVWDL